MIFSAEGKLNFECSHNCRNLTLCSHMTLYFHRVVSADEVEPCESCESNDAEAGATRITSARGSVVSQHINTRRSPPLPRYIPRPTTTTNDGNRETARYHEYTKARSTHFCLAGGDRWWH